MSYDIWLEADLGGPERARLDDDDPGNITYNVDAMFALALNDAEAVMSDQAPRVTRSRLFVEEDVRRLLTELADVAEVDRMLDRFVGTLDVLHCEHQWEHGPTLDMNPPINSRTCRKCGRSESQQDAPYGDGRWHVTRYRNVGSQGVRDGADVVLHRKDPALKRFIDRPAEEAIEPLRAAVARMEADPASYKALEPENGWGDYEGALAYLRRFLDACERHPRAIVSESALPWLLARLDHAMRLLDEVGSNIDAHTRAEGAGS